MGNEISTCTDISLGPWGYETGKEWSFKSKQGKAIKQIIVRYGVIIDSIVFKDTDDDYSPKFGGDGGDKLIKINIDFPSDALTGISGTYGSAWFFPNMVTSLTFRTEMTEYGPFGTKAGTPFSVNANDAGVTGFHGRCGQYIDAIGVYFKPGCALAFDAEWHSREIGPSYVPPRSAAAVGGDGGREWDDGVFSSVLGIQVRLCLDTGALSAVRFIYIKSDGSEFSSPFHGGYRDGEANSNMIIFEENESLIGIEGFYGEVEGMVGLSVIKGLSFITTRGKYGPLGAEIGRYFTSVNGSDCNRKVVGFHGRGGAYLDAIGLHTEYYS